MPRRINPIALYLVSLAVAIAAYAGYAQFAVPAIEGPPNIVKQRSADVAEQPQTVRDTSDKIAWLFPEGSWEREGCNRIMSPQGILLFKDYQPRENGLLDVIPFTMILNADSTTEPPTVLRAEKGARLQLDDSETARISGSGRLEQAQLAGDVIIYRPPTADDSDDALEITTSNVQIDQQRVFALEDVRFSLGRSSGSGRNLAIELINSSTSGIRGEGDLSGIDGFRRIELAFLNHLRLEPSQSSGAVLQAQQGLPGGRSSAGPLSGRSPINVSCSGSFVFDLEKNSAVFNHQVNVQEDRSGDSLSCDQLTLYFDETLPDDVAGRTGPGKDLKLRQMIANGSPARINASSRNSSVEGDQIDYDMVSGEFIVSGADGVVLSNPDYRFVAANIHYIMPEDGSIGPLDASGPGKMISRAEPEPGNPQARPFEASWQHKLTIRGLDNGQQLIELTGDPLVQLEAGTQIASEKLSFWLWRVDSLDARGNRTTEYIPAKMFSEGSVEIQSEQLSGTARQLVATWPGPGTRPARAGIPQSPDPSAPRPAPPETPRGFEQRDFEPLDFEQQNFEQRNFGTRNLPPASRTFEQSPAAARMIAADRISVRRIPQEFGAPAPDFGPQPDFAAQPAAQPDFGAQPRFAAQADIGTPQTRLTAPNGTYAFEPPPTNPAYPLTASAASSPRAPQPLINMDQPVVRAGFETGAQTQTALPTVTLQQSPARSRPPRRFRFDGDSVEILLGHIEDGSPVRDLVIDGNVLVNEVQNRDGSPLKISGRRMHMVPTTDDLFTLNVIGTDLDQAVVDAGRLRLSGADIRLDQAANEVSVDGPGEMSLARATAGQQRPGYGDESSLDVAWQGSMEFDGSRIHIERDVIMSSTSSSADGTVQQTNSRGTVLDATLVRPVNLREMEGGSSQQPTEIERLVLLNRAAAQQFEMISHPIGRDQERHPNVVVENKTFDRNGNLKEELQIIVPSATVQARGNDLKAHGPGTIINRSIGRSSATISMPGIDRENRNDGITYVQINFDGPLDARLDENRIRINGNVRTIYSPVNDWQSAINPDNPGRLPSGAALLTCERIEVDRWQRRDQREPTNELRASGNARVVSDEMEVTAERLNYDEADGMFVIEGTSRQNAVLSYQPAGSRNRQNLTGTKILYRPSDQWTHVQGIQDGTISSGRR